MQENVCALEVFDRAARLATLETATLSYVQYTDQITVSRLITKASIMASAVRRLMRRSLRYWKKIYHCYIKIHVKALPPF